MENVGVKLIEYYFCNSDYDAVAICELPDRDTAFSLNEAVKAMGLAKEMKTTELYSSEEASTAFRKAKYMEITPPKG